MPADEVTELRDALEALQDPHRSGQAQRSRTALERALLAMSAAGIETETETIAAAVRLLRGADDNGTTRLEVRDQAMTRRRWFEVNPSGDVNWGDR